MCGVFGVWGNEEASHLTYLGLHALQHRGQESAGIVATDGETLYSHRRMGRVADVFAAKDLDRLPGASAIGHVRYSTTGGSVLKNAQPFAVELAGASVAIAHNGNLTNTDALRAELEAAGAIFHSTIDTELIVHLLARTPGASMLERVRKVLRRLEGSYSLLIMTPHQLIAARDPHGFRPLVLGRLKNAHVLSSESCALRLVEASLVREVEPGELLVADADGLQSHRLDQDAAVEPRQCVFEHIYFARPDSELFGQGVYDVRKAIGRRLAQEFPVENADVVIPVPDSGVAAALGYAQASGLPYELGLIRSHYAGRTFIEPASSIRNFGVKLKLSPVEAVIRDKVVVVVDDSIVRGTTSRKIVRMLKEAGAREVHMRIACPPTTNPCYYGIDTPNKGELIASSHTTDEIARYLTADSLAYLSIEGLRRSVDGGERRFCDACFTGRYPVPIPGVSGRKSSLAERD